MTDPYFPLAMSTWRDPKIRALTGDAQALFWYLCSAPTRSACGVVPIMPRQWINTAAGRTQEMLDADLDQLTEHGFIVVDDDTGELLIPSWIDRDGTYKRRNQLRAAKHDAGLIQSERLRLVLAEALREIDLSQVKADKVGKDGQTERDRVEPILTEMYAMLNPNGDVQIYDAPNSVGDSVPDSVPKPLQDPVENPVPNYSGTSSPTTPGTSSEVLPNCSGTRAGAGARTGVTSTSTSTSSGARSASARNSLQSARARNTTSADAPATTDEPGQLFANNTVDITTGEVLTGTPDPQATDPWEAAAIEQHTSQPAHYGQTPPAFARAQAKTHRRPKTTETDEQEETRILHIIQRCDYPELTKACAKYGEVINRSEQLRAAVESRMKELRPTDQHPNDQPQGNAS